MKQLLYGFLLALGGILNVAAQTNQDVKLTGQIVCSQCWFEADRAQVAYGTPADLDCAKTCAAKSIPASLAVKNANAPALNRSEIQFSILIEVSGDCKGRRGPKNCKAGRI